MNSAPSVPPPPPPQDVSFSCNTVVSGNVVVSTTKMRHMVGSRTPGTIVIVGRAGSVVPPETSVVMKVLWWLKATQNSDGSWSSRSIGNNRLINTSFAVLTYLAHGEYPGSVSPYEKDFGPVVRKALDFLVSSIQQNSGGVRMTGSDGNENAFLITTYALCEAYDMTKNPNVKDAALVCLERIVKSQSATGGWNCLLDKSSTSDDIYAAGWALLALKASKMARLRLDGLDDCIKKAIHCLKTRNFNNGTFRSALEDVDGEQPGFAAIGCLALQLHGCGSDREVSAALDYMRDWKPSFDGKDILHNGKPHRGNVNPQLYCYYATWCKFLAAMKYGAKKEDIESWYAWNKDMKSLLKSKIIDLDAKVKDWTGMEHKQGYFKNDDRDSSRPYMDTCLAALQLIMWHSRVFPDIPNAAAKENTGEEGSAAQVIDSGDVVVEVDF